MNPPPQWAMLAAAAASMAAASWLTGTTTLGERVQRRTRSLAQPSHAGTAPNGQLITEHMPVISYSTSNDHWIDNHSHSEPQRTTGRSRLQRITFGIAAALGPLVVFNGPAGVLIGLVLGVAAVRLLAGRPDNHSRRRYKRLADDLPLALDLIAACLTAGAPVVTALETVADAVTGPLGAELSLVGRALRLGAPIDEACRRLLEPGLGERPPMDWWAAIRAPEITTAVREIATFARALARTEDSGARLAATLARLADQTRAHHQEHALAAARRAGVTAVAPLGLCFLPAFLALGVVPVIAGAGRGLAPL
ncbi:type II secretion system F family protein [Frankia sp. Cj3]|uniref:type II secretion system F family protein n=2 Tax=unclassified Frankia TaxID=2632575 RepID=UPI001EF49078|nr:type II secretion system F family protein [Frankia sp. Cj3]